jgi:hypothetical protein
MSFANLNRPFNALAMLQVRAYAWRSVVCKHKRIVASL